MNATTKSRRHEAHEEKLNHGKHGGRGIRRGAACRAGRCPRRPNRRTNNQPILKLFVRRFGRLEPPLRGVASNANASLKTRIASWCEERNTVFPRTVPSVCVRAFRGSALCPRPFSASFLMSSSVRRYVDPGDSRSTRRKSIFDEPADSSACTSPRRHRTMQGSL